MTANKTFSVAIDLPPGDCFFSFWGTDALNRADETRMAAQALVDGGDGFLQQKLNAVDQPFIPREPGKDLTWALSETDHPRSKCR